MTKTSIFPIVSPPTPEKRPVSDTHHGITRTDDYAWLRAGNWQEMFRDPSLLDAGIRAELEAENAYQSKLMADTVELQKQLFKEMKGRIKEDDSSVPMKDGPYAYGSSFKLGGEQPRYFRMPRDGGAEHILLDGDAEAAGKAYFRLGGVDHSADHARLLWAFDDKGSEFYTLHVRDLADGRELADQIPDTGGSGVWNAANDGFFYTRLDPNHRPSKVLFHALGDSPQSDRLIYEETDPGFFMNVDGTRNNEWIMIGINDHETSEYRLMRADDPFAEPKLVSPREIGLQYELEEGGDIFFILTNADGAKDFKIMTAPAGDPVRANWQELVPHEPGRLILSVSGFRDHMVRRERKEGRQRRGGKERKRGEEKRVEREEEEGERGRAGEEEEETESRRGEEAERTTPAQVFDDNMRTR
ncbi:S9 family peptidase, partial [Mesorhizobium sp. M7A.F.Ca.CA.004.06.1.1]